MELTERDYSLLELISKSGAVSNEQVKQLYGSPNKYHIKRLDKLSSEGYISRKNGFVTLKIKGLKAVGINSKPKKPKDFIVQKKAEMAELFFRMEGWDIVFAKEFKEKTGFYKGARIEAVISTDDYTFGIYHLHSKIPKANTLTVYLNEINSLPQKTYVDRAVIFCHPECADIIINRLDKPTVGELLLLPYPRGMRLIENRYNDYFESILREKYPGIKKGTSSMNFADYTWSTPDGSYYISDLLTGDAIKYHHLDNFYNNKLAVSLDKKIIIICTFVKYAETKKRYPKAIIDVMADTLGRFVPAPNGGM